MTDYPRNSEQVKNLKTGVPKPEGWPEEGQWTEAKAREFCDCITVRAKIVHETHDALVSGRMCDYALVWIEGINTYCKAEFSWAAVTRALNTGEALLFG